MLALTFPMLSLSLLTAAPRAATPADALLQGAVEVATAREYCPQPPASRLGDDEAPLPPCSAFDYSVWTGLLREAAARQTGHVDAWPPIPLAKSLTTLKLPRFSSAKEGPLGFAPVDARGLEALFKVLYVPPTTRVGNRTAQELYDALLARTVRSTVGVFGRMEASPKLVRAVLPLVRARAAAKASMLEVYDDVGKLLYDDPWADTGQYSPSSAAGFVLRRMLDGSWPTVRRLLERALADYDATALALLKGGTDALDGRALVQLEVSPADNAWALRIDEGVARAAPTLNVAVVPLGPRVFTFSGHEGGVAEVGMTVTAAGGRVKARLERDRWLVQLKSQRGYGELFIDGKPGSWRASLEPGHHVLELRGPCVVPERVELDVTLARRPTPPPLEGAPVMTRLRLDLVEASGAPAGGVWLNGAAKVAAGAEVAVPLCARWAHIEWSNGARSNQALSLRPDTLNVVKVVGPPPTP